MVRACLVDVYDTSLTAGFAARMRVLAEFAGADPGTWLRGWAETGEDRSRGKLSMADSIARALQACGIEPRPALVGELVRREAGLLRDDARRYDDTAVFFGELRSRGILSALVSNCSQSTRQMLEHLGMVALADSVILSCEVGWLKPSPEIYLSALTELAVAPADAVMIDDQASFCAGAEALGIRAIQIARPGPGKPAPPDSGFPVVTSLLDVPALL
jgi:putative hydrolase of the HAD superfamily